MCSTPAWNHAGVNTRQISKYRMTRTGIEHTLPKRIMPRNVDKNNATLSTRHVRVATGSVCKYITIGDCARGCGLGGCGSAADGAKLIP